MNGFDICAIFEHFQPGFLSLSYSQNMNGKILITYVETNDVLRNPEVYAKGYSPQNVTSYLSLDFASH